MTAPAVKGQLLIGALCDNIIREEEDLRHHIAHEIMNKLLKEFF